jgi:hypothetical protein
MLQVACTVALLYTRPGRQYCGTPLQYCSGQSLPGLPVLQYTTEVLSRAISAWFASAAVHNCSTVQGKLCLVCQYCSTPLWYCPGKALPGLPALQCTTAVLSRASSALFAGTAVHSCSTVQGKLCRCVPAAALCMQASLHHCGTTMPAMPTAPC